VLVASILEPVSTAALTIAGLSVVAYLARTWAAVRIGEAVKDEYRRGFEEFRSTLDWDAVRKERAAAVADFLAAWVAPRYDARKRNDEWRLEIQRQYWNLALWLDHETLRELNKAVGGDPAGNHKEALARVRKTIVGRGDPVAGNEFLHWDAHQPK
jgi:hypothetical protein